MSVGRCVQPVDERMAEKTEAQHPQSRAELAVSGVLLLCSLLGLYFGGVYFGLPGAILGFFLPTVGTLAMITASVSVLGLLHSGVPQVPVCRRGRCRGGRIFGLGDFTQGPTIVRYYCKCGDEYEKVGSRFMQRLPDGARLPHLAWQPMHAWRRDHGAPVPPSERAAP